MSVSQMTTDIFSMSVSQSRPSFSVHDLTPNMTCDRTFITSNTIDAASGVHPSLLVGFVLFSVHCCVVFCRPLFVLYTCSFWPLYCMSFDLSFLIIPYGVLKLVLLSMFGCEQGCLLPVDYQYNYVDNSTFLSWISFFFKDSLLGNN